MKSCPRTASVAGGARRKRRYGETNHRQNPPAYRQCGGELLRVLRLSASRYRFVWGRKPNHPLIDTKASERYIHYIPYCNFSDLVFFYIRNSGRPTFTHIRTSRTLIRRRLHVLHWGLANSRRLGVRLLCQGRTRTLLAHHCWPMALPAAGTVFREWTS